MRELIGTWGGEVETPQGMQFRHFLRITDMVAFNTFEGRDCGPTHYLINGGLMHRLDFLFGSRTIDQAVTQCYVNHLLGFRWQLGKQADHLPVTARCSIQLPQTPPPPPKFKWNVRKMQMALDDYELRAEFLRRFTITIEESVDEIKCLTTIYTQEAVEKHWCILNTAMMHVAQDMFGRVDGPRARWASNYFWKLTVEKAEVLVQWNRHCNDRPVWSKHNTMVMAKHMLGKWALYTKLEAICSKVRMQGRYEKAQYDNKMYDEMADALKHYDFRETWRLCRFLAGNGRGPRKRRLQAEQCVLPSLENWKDFLSTTEGNNCCFGEGKDIRDIIPPGTDPVRGQCFFSFEMFCREANQRLGRGKARPPWSVPGEIIRLFTEDLREARDRTPFAPCHAEEAYYLYDMSKHSREAGCYPQPWIDSWMHSLDKHNGKALCAGRRPLMMQDALSSVTTSLTLQEIPEGQPNFQAGCRAHHSVDDNLLMLTATQEQLTKAKVGWMSNFWDMATAFPSVEWIPLFARLETLQQEDGQEPHATRLLEQIHQRSKVVIRQADGTLVLVRKKGVREGCTSGPGLFNRGYAVPIQNTLNHVRMQRSKNITVEFEGEIYYLDGFLFVDDLATLSIVDSPKEARQQDQNISETLDQELSTWGMKQNRDKRESSVRLFGKGATQAMKQMYHAHPPELPPVGGKLITAPRYLGPRLHVSGKMRMEVRRRIAASASNVHDFSKVFRNPRTPAFARRVLFNSLCTGSLLSGMKGLPLTKKDEQILDTAQTLHARRALGKKGWGFYVGNTWRSVSTEAVRALMKLYPISIRLRHLRLKFFRSLVVHNREIVLASILGKPSWTRNVPVDPITGIPTEYASSWLNMIHGHLQDFLGGSWRGFTNNWKMRIKDITPQMLEDFLNEGAPLEVHESVEEGEIHALLDCEICIQQGKTHPPIHTDFGMRMHQLHRHGIWDVEAANVTGMRCPTCNRPFKHILSCRRHVKKQACGRRVTNPMAIAILNEEPPPPPRLRSRVGGWAAPTAPLVAQAHVVQPNESEQAEEPLGWFYDTTGDGPFQGSKLNSMQFKADLPQPSPVVHTPTPVETQPLPPTTGTKRNREGVSAVAKKPKSSHAFHCHRCGKGFLNLENHVCSAQTHSQGTPAAQTSTNVATLVGFENSGRNVCYQNAILQSLISARRMHALVTSRSDFWGTIFRNAMAGDGSAFVNSEAYLVWSTNFFHQNDQADASEFLMHVLQQWVFTGGSEVFRWVFRLHYTNGAQTSTRMFMPTYLQLYDVGEDVSLVTLLTNYVTYHTPTHRTQPITYPPVKVFVLPRAQIGVGHQQLNTVHVNFPPRLPGGQWSSSFLRSIVGYDGTGERGHYVAWVNRGQYWYRISDRSIQRVSAAQARAHTKEAYALVYEDP